MAIGKFKFLLISIAILGSILGSCSSTKSNYQKEYTRVWKEILKSEAWKNSLLTKKEDKEENSSELTTSRDVTGIADDRFTTRLNMEALFDKRFQSMVSRAYFKIISEAENADKRLSAEYDRWKAMQQNTDLLRDREFKRNYGLVIKKYNAHKKMLEGLKSWNIFSEYRSNDIDFFKAENKSEIQKMYENGSTEDQMINYLVYRLADLYHDED